MGRVPFWIEVVVDRLCLDKGSTDGEDSIGVTLAVDDTLGTGIT